MTKLTTMALAALFSASSVCGAMAQVQGQAYKSPEDCVADYGKLDTNQDGNIDDNESTQYKFIREDVDVNGDGMISDEEKRVSCERGIAKAFRSPK